MSVSRLRSDVNSTRQPKTTLALFHHSPPQNWHCASRLSRSALGDWEEHDSRRLISVLPRLGYRVGGREPASVNGQRLLLQLPRTVQKHGGNLRSRSCYCEHGADCVQTMPAITQRGPIGRKRFGGRCPHLDVDGIDENGPYEQHPCETKRTSEGEGEYRAPCPGKEGDHQCREESSHLDSSDLLPPVAVKRILHGNEERPGQGDLSRPRHYVAKNHACRERRQQ